MQPGIYRGIPNADYHSGPGISKSGLDVIRRSPAHYRAMVTAANDDARQPTAAQAVGTALHMLVLEPAEFTRSYTLAPSRADCPGAIDDRDTLVAMVQELNKGRKPKLPTGGSKAELIDRILAADAEDLPESLRCNRDELDGLKIADLKSRIETINESRPGLLPVSGSRHELAALLRANGVDVTLWSDYVDEWHRNNAGRQILSAEQFDQLRNMRDAIMAHPAAAKLLNAPGEAEVSAYWNEQIVDAATGEVIGEQLCRIRPDYWRYDGILVDLKTTDDASQEGFARSIAKWAYDVQDAYYLRGARKAIQQCDGLVHQWLPTSQDVDSDHCPFQTPKAFVFVAVEKTARVVDGVAMGVAVYRLDDESRAAGAMQWRRDLRAYVECLKSGRWPGYAEQVVEIKLPAWKLKQAAAAE